MTLLFERINTYTFYSSWDRYYTYTLKISTIPYTCGYQYNTNNTSIFPHIYGLESCRKWLRSFFYVKNATDVDLINLPAFVLDPPTEQHNWGYKPNDNVAEFKEIRRIIKQLKKEGMSANDLVATFISRRVSPLQRRVHKICHMSGPLDPTRTSTYELNKAQIRRHVKAIARTQMTYDWEWGKEPHSWNNLPPIVSNPRSQPT